MRKLMVVVAILGLAAAVAVGAALSSLRPGGLLYERVTAVAAARSGGTLSYRDLRVGGDLTATVEGLEWSDAAGRRASAARVELQPTVGLVTGGDVFPVATLVVVDGAVKLPEVEVTGLALEAGRSRPGRLSVKELRSPRLDAALSVEGTFGPVDPRELSLDLTVKTERGATLAARLAARTAEGRVTGRFDFGQAALGVLIEPTIAVVPTGILSLQGPLDEVTIDPSALSLALRYPGGEQKVEFPSGSVVVAARRDVVAKGLVVRSGPCQIAFDGRLDRAADPERAWQLNVGPGTISLPAVVAMLPPSARSSFTGVTPEGTVTLAGKLTGQGSPRPSLKADLAGVAVSRTEGTPFRFAVQRGSVVVEGLEDVRLEDAACLVNNIPLSLHGSYKVAGGATSVEGAVKGDRIPLAPLAHLALGGAQKELADSVRGTLTVDVRAEAAGGGAPVLGGSLQLRGAACALPVSTGTLVSLVLGDASIEVGSDSIRLRPVTVRVGGQPVALRAQVDQPLGGAPSISLSVRGERLPAAGLPLGDEQGPLCTRGTLSLVVEVDGPLSAPTVSGSLVLAGVALRGEDGQDRLVVSGTAGVQGLRLLPQPAGQARVDDLSVVVGKSTVRARTLELDLSEAGVRLKPATLDVSGSALEVSLSGPVRPQAQPLVLEVTPKGAPGPCLSVKAFQDPVRGWHVIALPRPLPLEIHAEVPPAAAGSPTVARLVGTAECELSAFAAWCRSWRVPALGAVASSLEGLGLSGGFKPDLALTLDRGRRTVAGSLVVSNLRGSVPAGAAALPLSCQPITLTVLDNRLTAAGVTADVGGLTVTVAKLAVRNLLGTPDLDVAVDVAEVPLARVLALAPQVQLPAGLTAEVPLRAAATVRGPWTKPRIEATVTLSPGTLAYRPASPLPGALGQRPLTAQVRGGALRFDGQALRLEHLEAASDLAGLVVSGAVRDPQAERGLFVDATVSVHAAPLVAALGVKLPSGARVRDDLVVSLKARGTPAAPTVQVALGEGSNVAFQLPSLRQPMTVSSLEAVWQPGTPLAARAVLAAGGALGVAVRVTATAAGGTPKVEVRGALPLERLGELVEVPANYHLKGEAVLSGEARTTTTGAVVTGTLACPRPPVFTMRTEGGRDVVTTTTRVGANFAFAAATSRFSVTGIEAELYDGLVRGSATVDLAGAAPALAYDLLVADLDLGRYMAEGVNLPGLMEGKVGLELKGTSAGLAVERLQGRGTLDVYDFALDVNKIAQMSGWGSYFPATAGEGGKSGLSSMLMGVALDMVSRKSSQVAAIKSILNIVKRKHRLGQIQAPLVIADGVLTAADVKSLEDPAALKGRVVINLKTLGLQGQATLGLKDETYRLTISNIVLSGTLSSPMGKPANGMNDFSLALLKPAAPVAPAAGGGAAVGGAALTGGAPRPPAYPGAAAAGDLPAGASSDLPAAAPAVPRATPPPPPLPVTRPPAPAPVAPAAGDLPASAPPPPPPPPAPAAPSAGDAPAAAPGDLPAGSP